VDFLMFGFLGNATANTMDKLRAMPWVKHRWKIWHDFQQLRVGLNNDRHKIEGSKERTKGWKGWIRYLHVPCCRKWPAVVLVNCCWLFVCQFFRNHFTEPQLSFSQHYSRWGEVLPKMK
jgi:hypothetical protein